MAKQKPKIDAETNKPAHFWENRETEVVADWIIHSYRWQGEARRVLVEYNHDMAVTELASRMRQAAFFDSNQLLGLCRALMEEALRNVQWSSLADHVIQAVEADFHVNPD